MKTDAPAKFYAVICVQTCSECRGVGIVQAAAWTRFWADYDTALKETNTRLNADAWARENGYDGVNAMGDEEVTCNNCDGTGKVRREVPLADALRELGVEVQP